MSEWDIVVTLGTVVSLFAVVVPPLVKLGSAITKLETTLDLLRKLYEESEQRNCAGHEALWHSVRGNDRRLGEQEGRIRALEAGKEQG